MMVRLGDFPIRVLVFLILLAYGQTSRDAINSIRNSAKFSYKIFQRVVQEKPTENVVVSPASIRLALGLTYMGAGGETAQELSTGLEFGTNDRHAIESMFWNFIKNYRNSSTVKIANKIYLKQGFEVSAEFNEIATRSFYSEVQLVNFVRNTETANIINGWIEQNTNNKIKNVIESRSIGLNTEMVLVNAFYLKADWEVPFDKSKTELSRFWINENQHIQVEMMENRQEQMFSYASYPNLDAKAIKLDYKNSDLSMVILLPNTRNGLRTLETKLYNENLLDLSENMNKSKMYIKMPKFQFETSTSLVSHLNALGISKIFSTAANFDNLIKRKTPLKISEVIHKVFIDVNEAGTEAAAVTGVISINRMSDSLTFNVDRPFIFYIRDGQGNILFIGKYQR